MVLGPLLKQLELGDNAETIESSEYSMWVQIHGLPLGFMSQMGKGIGEQLGKF